MIVISTKGGGMNRVGYVSMGDFDLLVVLKK